MGFENRDWGREKSYVEKISSWSVDFTPAVKALILVNVAVFLLQIFITRPGPIPEDIDEAIDQQIEQQKALHEKKRAAAKKSGKADKGEEIDWEKKKEELREDMLEARMYPRARVSVVQQWCELDPQKTVFQGQVWRLVTCAFCHDRYAILHLLFNMLLLYWFGSRLENMYGSREFLLFYLAAAVCGSAAYAGLALYTGSNVPAIGASGAVMGVMMLYAIYYPFETITLFWILPVPIWILLSLYVIYDLHPVLLALAGDHMYSRVAHAGHLGGLLFGFLYYKTGVRLEAPLERAPRRAPRRAKRPTPVAAAPPRVDSPREVLNEQVDEILKKISEQGKDSLTEVEKSILNLASARYRKEK